LIIVCLFILFLHSLSHNNITIFIYCFSFYALKTFSHVYIGWNDLIFHWFLPFCLSILYMHSVVVFFFFILRSELLHRVQTKVVFVNKGFYLFCISLSSSIALFFLLNIFSRFLFNYLIHLYHVSVQLNWNNWMNWFIS
jgi:hypothetical protein